MYSYRVFSKKDNEFIFLEKINNGFPSAVDFVLSSASGKDWRGVTYSSSDLIFTANLLKVDKNGCSIYDQDILEDSAGERYTVICDLIDGAELLNHRNGARLRFDSIDTNDYEVVGNSFQAL